MSDRLADWLRTVVPALWSSLVAWLVVKQLLPASLAGWANGLGAVVAVPLVLGAVYAGLRWFEALHWVPNWLTTILLGSARTPTYPPAGSATPAYTFGGVTVTGPYAPLESATNVTLYPIGGAAGQTLTTAVTYPPATPPSGPAGTSPPAPPA
jgi:hypothetical protein